MAMNTRKLLQFTNQSADCLYFCDSSCPYGCSPYVDLDYYSSPPPPPPPLPPPQLSSKNHQNISPYIIISVALFASLFLLVSYYLIIVKNCLNWNRRRTPPPQLASDEEFVDENRAPVIDHPIWYINTIGLRPSVIDKITIFKFKKGDGIVEGTNCSVCLNEFQDDESLRLLPNCKHAFHIHCIDTWLRSHTNCPLCRSSIVNAPAVVSIEPNLGTSLSTNEERVLENDEQREVNSNNEVRDREFRDNQEEFLLRRSVSVDSSINSSIGIDNMFMLSRMSEGEETVGENSSSNLHKEEAVLMKRSFSYGGRAFFSKHSRSRSSVLPSL
ncbi:hypothetical protein RND71_027883 [Anisodus tanguticus]|uniref:RING-type E3 ubiquitin transferase n=1 Tax=Anisodus tanguticus TaxID=243964 RepID=A0AAE1RIS6_9SOLA|nr:hypothetical protein RND71_027883 [Anisodus tanguticus]